MLVFSPIVYLLPVAAGMVALIGIATGLVAARSFIDDGEPVLLFMGTFLANIALLLTTMLIGATAIHYALVIWTVATVAMALVHFSIWFFTNPSGVRKRFPRVSRGFLFVLIVLANAIVFAGLFAYASLFVAPPPNDPMRVVVTLALSWLGFLLFLAAVDVTWQGTSDQAASQDTLDEPF